MHNARRHTKHDVVGFPFNFGQIRLYKIINDSVIISANVNNKFKTTHHSIKNRTHI